MVGKLDKHSRLITRLLLRSRENSDEYTQYGIQLPKSIKEALELNSLNYNDNWLRTTKKKCQRIALHLDNAINIP